MSKPRTFTKRIYLDTVFNRATSGSSNHWAGTTVKGYRVIYASVEDFQCDIVADPDSGSVQGIPMGYQRAHNYTTLANNAVFENKTPQAGVYIDVLISVEDPLIWTDSKIARSDVVINEGSNHTSQVVSVDPTTPTVIFAADSSRRMGVIQNKGPSSIFVGNPTAAELTNTDWQNICEEIPPGGVFVWKNAGALSGRANGATTKVSKRTEF